MQRDYITNIQGDVIALLNDAGNTAVSYTYDAWGNVLSVTGYEVGEIASSLGFSKIGQDFKTKGEDVVVGRTIYDDSHGAFSVIMWGAYGRISPFTAAYDLIVKLSG